MFKRHLITCVVAMALLSVFGGAQTPQAKAAKMEYPRDGWNFGTVIQGVQKQKKLQIRNVGQGTLVLHFTKVTCGCLKASPQKQSIKPNETGIITVDLDSFRQVGNIKKHIIISTNSPTERQVFIPVVGEIKPRYRLEATNLQLGQVDSGATASAKMKIYCLPGEWPEIKSIEHKQVGLKIGTTRFGEADGEHGIVVTAEVTALTKAMKLLVPVRINLKSGTPDAIRFSVIGEILGDLRLEPKKVKCPPLQKNKKHTVTLRIKSVSGAPFQVIKATCHDPRIAIGNLGIKQLAEQTVEITADPAGKLGVIRTRVYLVTNRTDQQVFTVPVEIRVIP